MHVTWRPVPLYSVLGLCLAFGATPACHAAIDEILPDGPTLARLELRAQLAPPRDQCFLYTELVHTLTELAGKQILAGDTDAANITLKKVERYAELVHLGLSEDPKRLKGAEQLMHHTAYRLQEYTHTASEEDRALLKLTLTHLNRIEDELLTQIFKH